MKETFSLLVGVSLFAILGNAQDGSAPVAYGIQGNVLYNRTLHERELARAADEARQEKVLKAAMAAQSPGRMVYTTAEDFLKANRPAMPEPRERPEPVRGNSYVPPFEDLSNDSRRTDTATPSVATEAGDAEFSKKDRKLFSWLKGKKAGTTNSLRQPGASDYEDSSTSESETGPNSVDSAPEPLGEQVAEVSAGLGSPEIAAAQDDAIRSATVGNGEFAETTTAKPKLFGKLFGKNREQTETNRPLTVSGPVEPTVAAEMIEEETPPAIPNTVSEAPELVSVAENGIPDSPGWSERAAPAPAAPEPAPAAVDTDPTSSIFVSRPEPPGGGEMATVKREGTANVEGVKVKLYAGTQVTVVKTGGLGATIQLPDGRRGTTQRSILKF